MEIGVGGGDDAHVHAPRVARADRHDLAVLEHAQQLRLERRRHVADLVEEQRAAVRQLEPSLAIGGRAGERAAHVAEEHRLGQLAGDGDAVHRDERRLRARAAAVNRAGDELLAGAALAGDQHVRAGELMQPLDVREDRPHEPAAADEPRDPPPLHVLLRERHEPLGRGAARRFRLLAPADLRSRARGCAPTTSRVSRAIWRCVSTRTSTSSAWNGFEM